MRNVVYTMIEACWEVVKLLAFLLAAVADALDDD